MKTELIEHPLEKSPRFLYYLKLYTGFFPSLAGFWIAIMWHRIGESTKLFFDKFGSNYYSPIDWLVVVFWFLFFLWIISFAVYVTKDEINSRDKIMHLIRAIHHIPDIEIFKTYPENFGKITNELKKGNINSLNKEQ
jgi:hypothetical protein